MLIIERHSPDKQHPEFVVASKGGHSPQHTGITVRITCHSGDDTTHVQVQFSNRASGRNPWKSATTSDPTFWTYFHGRAHFLPTVLPILPELNAILVCTLDVIWTTRIILRELRAEIHRLPSIYAHDIVFEHSRGSLHLGGYEKDGVTTASLTSGQDGWAYKAI
jgi:hypothetical protein